MEEWDLEEDGTGAVSQLTSFQKDVLHALAAYDDKYTARALTDFAHGTVDEVSRALDALCDADIVVRLRVRGDYGCELAAGKTLASPSQRFGVVAIP